MKYTGRILAFTLDLLFIFMFIFFYYRAYGRIQPFELLGDLLSLGLAWWCGKQYDKAKFYEKKSQEEEERYRSLVELSPTPIVVHQKGYIVYVNPACLTLLGAKKKEELIGQTILSFVHPDYQELVENRVHVMQSEFKKVNLIEEKFIRLDGQTIDVEVVAEPITYMNVMATQVMIQDVTERKKAERALQENEERYRFITENSTDMITRLTEDGMIEYVSPACSWLLGYEPNNSEMIKQSYFDFIHPNDKEKMVQLQSNMRVSPNICTFSHRVRKRSGEYIWFETTARRVTQEQGGGGLPGFIAVSRDVTERKLTEHKLQKANVLLRRLSTIDGLTRVANRRFFDQYLEREWKNALRKSTSLSLIMLDIDFFKGYNDHYGHQRGDDCLKQVASLLKNAVKRPTDLVARYGGEEFAIILPETDGNGALFVAERCRKRVVAMKMPHMKSKVSAYVTVSVGVATMVPVSTSSPAELISMADHALYESKLKGRNQVNLHAVPQLI